MRTHLLRLSLLCVAILVSGCSTADGEVLSEGTGGACTVDADCRVEADYCTACDCRALAKNQKLPACPGPGVRCVVDPCKGKAAVCSNGACAVDAPSR